MEYVYAALLLHYARQPITEENIARVVQAAGVGVDEVKVKALVAALKEINIEDVLKSAMVPVAPAQAPAPTAPAQAPQPVKKVEEAEKKEEKGPSEEEIASGLASLFG